MKMAFALIDPTFAVMVHGNDAPTEAEWQEWVDTLTAGKVEKLLVETTGGAPNSRQRSLVAPTLAARKVAVAIMSQNVLVRGILTAFNWLGVNSTKTFPPQDLQGALTYLGRPGDQVLVMSMLSTLRQKLTEKANVATNA